MKHIFYFVTILFFGIDNTFSQTLSIPDYYEVKKYGVVTSPTDVFCLGPKRISALKDSIKNGRNAMLGSAEAFVAIRYSSDSTLKLDSIRNGCLLLIIFEFTDSSEVNNMSFEVKTEDDNLICKKQLKRLGLFRKGTSYSYKNEGFAGGKQYMDSNTSPNEYYDFIEIKSDVVITKPFYVYQYNTNKGHKKIQKYQVKPKSK